MPFNSIQVGEFRIDIVYDTYPENPRTAWDNLGTMVCFHNRYDLGDTLKHKYEQEDYNSWDELKEQLIKDGAFVILPLYLYDHSGITMNTTGFHCPWDSGQVGFIYITHKKAKHEYGKDYESRKEDIKKYLENEVSTYDNYLTGNVYGFEVYDDDENLVDSCYGFYGDLGIADAEEQAQSIIENKDNSNAYIEYFN